MKEYLCIPGLLKSWAGELKANLRLPIPFHCFTYNTISASHYLIFNNNNKKVFCKASKDALPGDEWFPNLSWHQNHLECLLKQIECPAPGASDSVALGWGPKTGLTSSQMVLILRILGL